MTPPSAEELLGRLERRLAEPGDALIAFSGGVDSSLLAVAAARALGERHLAITIVSPVFPKRELESARALSRDFGVRFEELPVEEIPGPEFKRNDADRCYHCKKYLFGRLKELAAERGFHHLLDGSNVDDAGDYRPGTRAAKELGVESPFVDLGFGKTQIRALSRALRLPCAELPAKACLASRIAYGVAVEPELLRMIEAAEDFLLGFGSPNLRVRVHPGLLARLEVPADEIGKFAASPLREKIRAKLKELGFVHVSLDLGGYRTGSMNECLEKARKR